MVRDWKSVGAAVDGVNVALQNYQRRMQEKYGRPGEGTTERLGDGVERVGSGYRNKDGWSSDATGRAMSQGIWTRPAIIEYLKSSGLDAMLAEKLSERYVDANGNVAYSANDEQQRWAGKFGSLSDALGKMAEYFRYDQAGRLEGEQIVGVERSRREQRGQLPAQPSHPSGSSSSSGSASGGATYISNITLPGPGGRRETMRFADADSQASNERLLRDLAAARGVAQR